MGDRVVMGYWDCQMCGTKGIRGDVYDCPNCGSQRGDNVKFYLKDGVREVVDEEPEKHRADWYCAYCNSLNSANSSVCENCGSARDEAEDDYFSLNEKKSVSSEQKKRNNELKARLKKRRGKRSFGIVSVIFVILFFYFFVSVMAIVPAFFGAIRDRPRDAEFRVTSVEWKCNKLYQRYQTVSKEGWSIPSNGRKTGSISKVKKYRKVRDGYETVTKSRTVQSGYHTEYESIDNGDGTFTEKSYRVPDYETEYYEVEVPKYRDEPVYDDWYFYDVDEWVTEKEYPTSGTDRKPKYASVSTKDFSKKERIRKVDTTYWMEGIEKRKKDGVLDFFTSEKEKEEKYEIDKGLWERIEKGTVLVRDKNDVMQEWKIK